MCSQDTVNIGSNSSSRKRFVDGYLYPISTLLGEPFVRNNVCGKMVGSGFPRYLLGLFFADFLLSEIICEN